MNPLNKAIDAAGGVGKLAERLGIVQTAVSNWRIRGRVPAEQCLAIEAATGVSRHDLRPDVFGPAPPNQPAANDDSVEAA